MDKQTCRRPRGHRKHGGVAGVGGAVKREIRVHPRARFSIVRPAAFVERQRRGGVSRWKLICRDEKYRRRRTVSSWKYVALPSIRESRDVYRAAAPDSRRRVGVRPFDLYKCARSHKGSDFNRIAREYRAKTFGEKIAVHRDPLAIATAMSENLNVQSLNNTGCSPRSATSVPFRLFKYAHK